MKPDKPFQRETVKLELPNTAQVKVYIFFLKRIIFDRMLLNQRRVVPVFDVEELTVLNVITVDW